MTDETNDVTPVWMNSAEAAAYARVSTGTIVAAAARGDLVGAKVKADSTRSEWRFRPRWVDDWLERGIVTRTRRPRRRSA